MSESVEKKNSSGLAAAGMVLGIIGVVLSFIPIINNISVKTISGLSFNVLTFKINTRITSAIA